MEGCPRLQKNLGLDHISGRKGVEHDVFAKMPYIWASYIRYIGKTAENAYFFYLDPENGIFCLNLIYIYTPTKSGQKTLE